MRFLLVLLITACWSGAAAVKSPIFGICLFLWHDIFQPLTFAYSLGALPLAPYTLAVMGASTLFHAFRGKVRLSWNLFHTLLLAFLAWILVCTMVSPYPSAWEGMILIAKYLVPMGVIAAVAQTRRDLEWITGTLMFSVGIWAAAAGILGPVHGSYPYLNIEGGQMTDNNEVAAATVGYVPFLLYFIFNYSWKFRLPVRLGLAAFFVITLSSIAFSQSRGATVALAVLTLFYITLMSRHRIRDGIVLSAVIAGALWFAPSSFWERIGTINVGVEQTEASAQNRLALMKAAWEGTLDNPVFGMGPYCWLDGYAQYIDDRHNPHDVWLKCSVEIGLPGLFIFLAIIGAVCFGMHRVSRLSLKAGDRRTSNLALAVMASIIGICVALSFLSQPYWEYLWAILAGGAGFHARYMRDYPRMLSLKKEARKKPAEGKQAAPGDPGRGA